MVVLLTWNVRGVISSTLCLSSLLDDTLSDIAIICEHKLKQSSAQYLDTIHSDFYSFVKTESEDDMNLKRGNSCFVGRGGVAIIARKTLSFSIKEIDCSQSSRVIGIELSSTNSNSLFIFGVYLPSDNDINAYCHELSIIESLYSYYSNYGTVIVAGDLNGSIIDTKDTNLNKSHILTQFVENCNFCVPFTDFSVLGETFTFVQKKTMLDYVFFDKSVVRNIKSYHILKEGSISITSDHLPIVVTVDANVKRHHLQSSNSVFPAWHKASPEAIACYKAMVRTELANLRPCGHTPDDLIAYTQSLVNTLEYCSAYCIPYSGCKRFTRPGWTKNVKHLHSVERAKRRIWIGEGRPRGMSFDSYREYKRAKREFRNALDNEYEQYMYSVYQDIDTAAECDIRLFWRLIKRQKPRSSRLYPEIRDDAGNIYNDPEGVANAFASFYEELYAPLSGERFDFEFSSTIDTEYDLLKRDNALDNGNLPGGIVTPDDVKLAIRGLKLRKTPGEDDITNEHIIYGGAPIVECLTNLYNAVILVGKIPPFWKRGLIVPLHKGGSKPKDLCGSYRPVALLSSLYKLLEKIIHTRIMTFTLADTEFPNSQQQGFQKIPRMPYSLFQPPRNYIL